MSPDDVSRRGFLRGIGATAVLALAGCAESPQEETDPLTPERTTQTPLGGRNETIKELDGTNVSRFSEVYRAVRDSVVQIRVRTGARGTGAGTGFVYDDTHLVTNEHVVANAQDLFVRYRTTGWRDATIEGTDTYSDLAVLRVDDRPNVATALPLRSRDPPVGTEVVAIGNPYELSGTVSSGIVSGVDRTLSAPNNFSIPDTIQTDAPVNPGNSGGPLVDLEGRVVGVISAGGGDNIGLAISAPLTRQVVPALIETGSYDHPYLGVGLENVTPAIAAANDLEEATGVYVSRVVADGPSAGVLQGSTGEQSADGGLAPAGGDVITHLAGEPVPTRATLSSVLALETVPGEPTDLRIIRDGNAETVTVDIGARPAV
ncbi:S1C family serine protease [Halorhabdus rudnickae]|uniref:S1C family serine protease n=1 Tax=Halorhabdus rudnickae TaxID=1775544 RepID=UPI0010824AC7|nr:trypsin-like peptidase domain-containing protein [Halorhabdus rudnickae]